MTYDLFILILDDDSAYVKNGLSYDSAIAEHTQPDSTVILISANETLQRIIPGNDASTIIHPLPALLPGGNAPEPDPFGRVSEWIVEAQFTREGDDRPTNSTGVLVDIDPTWNEELLRGLRADKSITLIEEISTRANLRKRPVLTKPKTKSAKPTPKSKPAKPTPKSKPLTTTTVTTPVTQQTVSSVTPPHLSPPPPPPPGPPPVVTPAGKSKRMFAVALITVFVIGLVSVVYGSPLTLIRGTTSGSSAGQSGTPENTRELALASPEMTGRGVTEIDNQMMSVASPVGETVLERSGTPSQGLGRQTMDIPLYTSGGTIYYDIGSDVSEPTLKRFGTAEIAGVCELGGFPDKTRRPQLGTLGRDFPAISVPVLRGVEASISFCINEDAVPSDWSVWLGNLPPAAYGCQSLHLSKPGDVVMGLNVVNWTIPAECVHRDDLMLVFVGGASQGNAVWGLSVSQ